ncbi:hypothetical protein HYH03_001379 [Edaphochlamys debaryana]|uniref:SET domain-containing protein n=1 Tax=Edaphochlamys debaryana TaxID=47281 RepID=A0A835YCV2_9CHLO|nr:hypothetical protein HYH03_001379 [Edaphochlamys debaryana]|eukprot:KAG2500612.1 hypothetical protein HYH03_001379 [Edaphochlamys debaryana]
MLGSLKSALGGSRVKLWSANPAIDRETGMSTQLGQPTRPTGEPGEAAADRGGDSPTLEEPSLVEQHEAARLQHARRLRENPSLATRVFHVPVGRFCRLPLSDLAPISLSDLQPGALHVGKYVICRTLATPFRLRAVFTVVQGLTGPQQRLSVYNLATDPVEISPGCSADLSSHLLPRGSVIAIKEPWLKRGSAGPMYGIRVDSPLDLLVLDDLTHPLVAGTPWAQLVAESPAGRRRAEAAAVARVAGGSGAGSGGECSSSGGEDGEGDLAEADRSAAEAAARWHEEGNRLYGAGAHVDALACYQEGLEALRPLLTRLEAAEGGRGAAGLEGVGLPGSSSNSCDSSGAGSGSSGGGSSNSSGSSLLGSALLPQLLRRRLALLSNCAAACLGFGDPASALRWADRVLALQPAHPKALSRRSAALAGLGRYGEAAEAYRSFLAAAPPGPREAPACRLHLSRLQQRRSEAEAGAYDEAGMAREAGRSAAPRLEAADFVGPVAVADMDAGGRTGREAEAVAVSTEGSTQQAGAAAGKGAEAAGGQQRSRGRGRGLVTTRAVAAGELLLACKADAVCFLGEVQAPASAAAAPTCSSLVSAPGCSEEGGPRGLAHAQLDRDLVPSVLGCGRLAHRLAHLVGVSRRRPVPPLPGPECDYGVALGVEGGAGGGSGGRGNGAACSGRAGASGGRSGSARGVGAGAQPGAGGGEGAPLPPLARSSCGPGNGQEDGQRAAEGPASTCTCGGGMATSEEGPVTTAAGQTSEPAREPGPGEGPAQADGASPTPLLPGLDGWLRESGLVKVSPAGLAWVDEDALARVTARNVFTPHALPELVLGLRPAQGAEGGRAHAAAYCQASGVWSLASYINHACVGTAHRYFIGDFMFVRTAEDLPAGTEVTHSYVDSLDSLEDRTAALQRHGFVCGCELCQEDRAWGAQQPEQAREAEAALAEYEALRSRTAAAARNPARAAALIARLQGVVARLESALQSRPRWRLAVFNPASELAYLLQTVGDVRGSVDAYRKAYACLHRGAAPGLPAGGPEAAPGAQGAAARGAAPAPFVISPTATQLAVSIAASHVRLGGAEEHRAARRWEAAARAHWRVLYGNEALFSQRFAEPLELIKRAKA